MTDSIDDIIISRYGRRKFLGQALTITAAAALAPFWKASAQTSTALASWTTENLSLADEYEYEVLLKWGEVLKGGPVGAIGKITADEQARAFGYNNDFIAFIDLPAANAKSAKADSALLCVNHEYPVGDMMFPEGTLAAQRAAVEMAAVGHSIVEITRKDKSWHKVNGSQYNRRLTATTRTEASGYAAGSDRMKTTADPSGTKIIGTFQNCSGGVTPWNNVLTCEENIDAVFSGKLPDSNREQANHTRMGIARNDDYAHWAALDERFNISIHPNEPNRFGWVVEVNPFDPLSVPIKRTSLGRFKHEGARVVVNKDGRLVIYMGDDESGEHIYRYVSATPYNSKDSSSRNDVLDNGTLYAAKFEASGKLHWLPLIHGEGKLNKAHGFDNQADIMIEARRAASIVGATPMDRPEGIAISPITNSVYVSLTKNLFPKMPNPANPRPVNKNGHIIEFTPPDADHAANEFSWEMFYIPEASEGLPSGNRLSNPDNLAFSPSGDLWVGTDGMKNSINQPDGLFKLSTRGSGGRIAHRILAAPVDAEVTGPCFSSDGKTLFVSIQHPGESSSFASPASRWPDFDPALPCRPSVIAIRRKDGNIL